MEGKGGERERERESEGERERERKKRVDERERKRERGRDFYKKKKTIIAFSPCRATSFHRPRQGPSCPFGPEIDT